MAFAERAGLGELGETPLAVEPVGGQDQDDGFTVGQLAVQLSFPPRTRRDATVLVEIQEDIGESTTAQPGDEAARLRLVSA